MVSDNAKRAIRSGLLTWFGRNARRLPWRGTGDAYLVWVSEIMLQQTRVETCLPYYRRFVEAFPTVRDLAAADEDRVLKLWEGLGYYGRARNLLRSARAIVGEHGGRLPTTVEGWRALPGVGRYSAGAIASIAFGRRAAAVDGNVKRVLARVFAIGSPVNTPATDEKLWRLAEELLPARAVGDFNQSLMELGATVCLPRRPRCPECPIRARCEARRQGIQEELPRHTARKRPPHYEVVAGAILRRGRYLLGKRPAGGLLGGLWELPGGKVEPGETHEAALRRELREELGIEVRVGERIASVEHAYSHFSITLNVYRCEPAGGRAMAKFHSRICWVPRGQLGRYAFPAANRKVLPLL